MILQLGKINKKPLSQLFPEASKSGLDLLSKMLIFDPNKRINVDEALNHPYLAEVNMEKEVNVFLVKKE